MPAPSTPIYGIDTSVFVRLLTGHPEADFKATTTAIQEIFENEPSTELVVSNQVIGESYITLQFHYKLSKVDARAGILKLLSDGMVSPLNGSPVLELLRKEGGAGLMDRLIIQDYQERGIMVLTHDKTMAKVTGAQLLQ
jgi:predicted nucleic-acid-binding protein